jgi:hypothetical protein
MLCNWIMVSFIIVVSSKFILDILLVFQPPYCPELNPIERVWQYIKQELSWGLYDNLDKIKEKVRSFIEEFSSETIASIAGWDYIRAALATLCMILEKWYYFSQAASQY